MKNTNKFFMMLMALPFVLMSCGNSISDQIKKEMLSMKSQCPQYLSEGLIMTDVNFYENEKVMEYIYSIEGLEYLGDSFTEVMKEGLIEAFSSDISAYEKFSVKTILKGGYRFRYIYNDAEGNNLCKIDITKDDLQ
ncbi:MAG: hypothetical protein LBI82_01925 [Dysgonamonadaceae bacterium]|jgi:predicted transglutaminase-like protease|nr:hypothetical protein [Dysgonamonadaceae bacterium]